MFSLEMGKILFFWFDDWLKMGKLFDIKGVMGPCYLGVARNARVCEAVMLDQWSIRGHISHHFQELHAKIQAIPAPSAQQSDDIILWRHSPDIYKPYFSITNTWEQVRSKREDVLWSSSIWFPQGVPRFSFIVWLAVIIVMTSGYKRSCNVSQLI